MRQHLPTLRFVRPARNSALLALTFSLLVSTAPSSHAQSGGYNAPPPPPPISNYSPRGGKRGVYVLPGTMTNREPRALPALPPKQDMAAPERSASSLPSPRRLNDADAMGNIELPRHQAGTPLNLRYIRRPMPARQPYYPTPEPVQQQPMMQPQMVQPSLQPQAPVATTTPEIPFGEPSAPLQPQVTAEQASPSVQQWQPVPLEQAQEEVPQDDVMEEFNALTQAPTTAAAEDATPPTENDGLTETDEEPTTLATPVEPVVDLPLSEESRKILDGTPSGIDTVTTIRSPKPVIIKRTDPNAGLIPKADVRSHEELGLKIEVRRPDVNIQTYLEDGYENLLEKRYAIAAGYYQEALRIERDNESALFGLATTYHRMGQREEARQLYSELLEVNPTHREGLNNFMALISEESPSAAIEALEKLETENPDFSPIPAQLGIVYNRMGDPRMAARKLARALNLSPENLSYKYNLAITLDQLGQVEEASDLYLELIEAYNNGATLPGNVEDLRNRVISINQK